MWAHLHYLHPAVCAWATPMLTSDANSTFPVIGRRLWVQPNVQLNQEDYIAGDSLKGYLK